MCELCPLVLEFGLTKLHEILSLICGMKDGQIIKIDSLDEIARYGSLIPRTVITLLSY